MRQEEEEEEEEEEEDIILRIYELIKLDKIRLLAV
jgi:hypothetical protein